MSGVQAATKLGRGCPQGGQGLAASGPFALNQRETDDELEDCLFAKYGNINVHTLMFRALQCLCIRDGQSGRENARACLDSWWRVS